MRTTRLGVLCVLGLWAGLWSGPCGASPPADTIDAPALTGRLTVDGAHRVLTLWGTPYERGFAHGYLLAEHVLAGLRYDLEQVMKPLLPKYEGMVVKAVAPAFAFAPHEEEELRGLFDGLRKRLPEADRALASLKRPVTLNDLKALNTFGDWYPLACSSCAVWGDRTEDGSTLVGRNFDFPGFELLLEHQIIVVRAAEKGRHGSVSVAYPGCIGATTGMSTQGLFVSIHDVPVRPPMLKALQANVPRLLTVRRLFEQVDGDRPVETAHKLVAGWQTLYGNNLMVAGDAKGDAVRAGVLETDHREDLDEGATLRPARPDEVCLACTNHHRARKEVHVPNPLFKRWRYPRLLQEAGRTDAETFTVRSMFELMEHTAFPRNGKPQIRVKNLLEVATRKGFGTLHQAVGETGARRLHLKMAVAGEHITSQPAKTYDVKKLVAAK